MTPPMNFARMRHRLTIETPVRVPDGYGGFTETWSAMGEVFARIFATQGRERLYADRFSGHATHEIVMRYRGDVSPGQRLRLGARVFEIRAAIDVEERHRFLRCITEEMPL